MPKATNGAERGTCIKPLAHRHKCASRTCFVCGAFLIAGVATPSTVARGTGQCHSCAASDSRALSRARGVKPMNIQISGQPHTFPCGCSGVLPAKRGESNKFAKWHGLVWKCRAGFIIGTSQHAAQARKYTPIDSNTPHSIIRGMMEAAHCERCGGLLNWDDLGPGTTPHLDHNHETGEIRGFAHPSCNAVRLRQEIIHLSRKNARLKRALDRVRKENRALQSRDAALVAVELRMR